MPRNEVTRTLGNFIDLLLHIDELHRDLGHSWGMRDAESAFRLFAAESALRALSPLSAIDIDHVGSLLSRFPNDEFLDQLNRDREGQAVVRSWMEFLADANHRGVDDISARQLTVIAVGEIDGVLSARLESD